MNYSWFSLVLGFGLLICSGSSLASTSAAVTSNRKTSTTTKPSHSTPHVVNRRPPPQNKIRHKKLNETELNVPCIPDRHLLPYAPHYNATCLEMNDAYTYYSLLRDAIEQKKPFYVGKCGATELRAIMLVDLARRPDGSAHNFEIKPQLFYHSGVYPINEAFVVKFTEVYQSALDQMDLNVEWNREENQEKFFRHIPNRVLSLTAQSSWYWKTPFSHLFEGKTVLVISPFHHYVEKQYHDHRECIFAHDFDREVLPEFTLRAIAAPLPMWNVSISRASQFETFRGRTWLTALEELKQQMREIDFDIALIGAGAFGLPLGAEAKRLGKVGIVLGGTLGPLFGIKGHRFDAHGIYKDFFYNNCWVRMEKPQGADKMEQAAYWRK